MESAQTLLPDVFRFVENVLARLAFLGITVIAGIAVAVMPSLSDIPMSPWWAMLVIGGAFAIGLLRVNYNRFVELKTVYLNQEVLDQLEDFRAKACDLLAEIDGGGDLATWKRKEAAWLQATKTYMSEKLPRATASVNVGCTVQRVYSRGSVIPRKPLTKPLYRSRSCYEMLVFLPG